MGGHTRADGTAIVSVAVMVLLTRLVGVYDADGGFVGEARYVVGHLLGRAECALCDITHGPVRRKRAFDDLCARLGVPFDVVHRNERSPDLADATGSVLPCVVAEAEGRIVPLLGPEDLARCGGDVGRFGTALHAAIAGLGFVVPRAERGQP